ncbi:related to mitochondrial outer membrane protein (Sam35) [Cephalotrichum gorgonifer]|uniref:Related to mitochondrial outer membrane protein (Sam35) n=1 Tax=Cephalotrichum gorgonifer TaxID=2041049 RepID=A0AAE8SRN9_9PEZI|nr:related to mitochondrial outer membrane protein (Sam35) [Cephalotrichum gorgonifer]
MAEPPPPDTAPASEAPAAAPAQAQAQAQAQAPTPAPSSAAPTPTPAPAPAPAPAPSPAPSSIFAIPAPLRRLFNHFPLRTTPETPLPARCAVTSSANLPILFLFTTEDGARDGLPSFNPACLKWQTYLKMNGLDFTVRPSNNHASPSGALPFLLTPAPAAEALPSSKLESYVSRTAANNNNRTHHPRPSPARTHPSLLDSALRPAYLHALYLSAPNTPLLTSLYVPPENPYPVRASLLHTLRAAAEEEILAVTRSPFVNPDAIYAAAEEALEALEDLLRGKEWFFEGEEGEEERERGPTLFDASVFAYTNFLLEDRFVWGDERLRGLVAGFPSLVEHRGRILGKYWPEEAKR